jgi:uncharacterized protein (TIGR00730 family)
MKSICVYCGSSDKVRPAYLAVARDMGIAIARRGIQLWYGAGSTGLMGALAESALQAGGEVIGVIPAMFNNPILAHYGLTRLEVVDSMHERKQRLAEQADGFIALPGGYGTLEELFEILTWAQIGLHAKPVGVLNAFGYYDLLLSMVEHALVEGFIYNEHRLLLHTAQSPEELLDAMLTYQAPEGLERWLTRTD